MSEGGSGKDHRRADKRGSAVGWHGEQEWKWIGPLPLRAVIVPEFQKGPS